MISLQAALAACCLFMPAGAHAQQDDTFNRLNRLEREIDTLNRAIYRGDAPPPSSESAAGDSGYQSNLEVRLADLEKQLRDLTGKLEQQTFEIRQLRERMDRTQADMELRLGDLEKKNGLPQQSGVEGNLAPDESGTPPMPSAQAGQPPVTDPNAPAPANSPTQRQLGTLREAPGGAVIPPDAGSDDPAGSYEHAFSQLKSGNYNGAQRSFDGFLNQYPAHPLAPNATYWLGETYYAQGKYDQATRIFAESYKKYPQGPKAADSLLKLGMSLGADGKTQEACVSLKQLKKTFSAGQSTAVRRADQEMTRFGCSS